jgi:hypothetical protein
MEALKLSILTSALIFSVMGCSPDNPAPIVAGKGGNATITFSLTHHGVGRNIIHSKVYVKYNAQDLPTTSYDDSAIGLEDASDTIQLAVFTGLKNGNYYFYGTGCDTSLYQQVVGGLPFTITVQGPQTYNLPISENGKPCP